MNPEAGGRWGRRRGSGAVGAGTGEWGGGGGSEPGRRGIDAPAEGRPGGLRRALAGSWQLMKDHP